MFPCQQLAREVWEPQDHPPQIPLVNALLPIHRKQPPHSEQLVRREITSSFSTANTEAPAPHNRSK